MKFKVIASDELYGRMLTLELTAAGLEPVKSDADRYELLCAEGQTELIGSRRLTAAILVDCGILAAGLPESVKLLILDRPFSLVELRAFVAGLRGEDEAREDDGIRLIPDELSVEFGDECVKLTRREFSLFSYLFARPYETVSRNELLTQLWNDEKARETNVVEVYINFLRAKLDDKFGVKLIRSKRGEGYSYSPEVRKPKGRENPKPEGGGLSEVSADMTVANAVMPESGGTVDTNVGTGTTAGATGTITDSTAANASMSGSRTVGDDTTSNTVNAKTDAADISNTSSVRVRKNGTKPNAKKKGDVVIE